MRVKYTYPVSCNEDRDKHALARITGQCLIAVISEDIILYIQNNQTNISHVKHALAKGRRCERPTFRGLFL